MAEAIRGTAERFDLLARFQPPALPRRPHPHADAGGGDAVLPDQGRVLSEVTLSCARQFAHVGK